MTKKTTTSIQLPDKLYEEIRTYAEANSISMGDAIRLAISNWLRKNR